MKRVLLAICGGAGVVAMSTAVLAQQSPASGLDTPQPQRPAQEVVLQGCVAVDQATGHSRATAPGAAAGGGFLLTQATRRDASRDDSAGGGAATQDPSARPVQGATPSGRQSAYQQSTQQPDVAGGATATYRLVTTGSDVNLREHVGHRVEVRGRVADVTGVTGSGGDVRPANRPGAPEGTQHGQGGQRTTTPANTQAGQPADDEMADAGRAPAAVMVTSVTMLADSCGTR